MGLKQIFASQLFSRESNIDICFQGLVYQDYKPVFWSPSSRCLSWFAYAEVALRGPLHSRLCASVERPWQRRSWSTTRSTSAEPSTPHSPSARCPRPWPRPDWRGASPCWCGPLSPGPFLLTRPCASCPTPSESRQRGAAPFAVISISGASCKYVHDVSSPRLFRK